MHSKKQKIRKMRLLIKNYFLFKNKKEHKIPYFLFLKTKKQDVFVKQL